MVTGGMSVSPKIYMGKPDPQGDGIRRRALRGDGVVRVEPPERDSFPVRRTPTRREDGHRVTLVLRRGGCRGGGTWHVLGLGAMQGGEPGAGMREAGRLGRGGPQAAWVSHSRLGQQ